MDIHPHEGLLRAARAQARTPRIQAGLPDPGGDRADHRLDRHQNGRRVRLSYIGAARNNAWLHNRSAAINLRTLINAGLTRRGGAWTLA